MAPIEDYVHKPDNAASSLSEILEEYCLDPIFEVTPENLYDCVGILETLLAENPPLNPKFLKPWERHLILTMDPNYEYLELILDFVFEKALDVDEPEVYAKLCETLQNVEVPDYKRPGKNIGFANMLSAR